MSVTTASIRDRLEAHNQGHLLTFFDQLDAKRQRTLIEQIESLNLAALDRLIDEYVLNPKPAPLPGALEPAPYYPLNAGDESKYRAVGEDLIRNGRIAAFTVAGGQGTRLGWNGPKGTCLATVVTGKPLFRLFAEQVLANQERYGVTVPWYIMTSPINDAQTRAFFNDNNWFGLSRRDVIMFPQGVIPSFEMGTGRMLLAEKHEVAVNPDGHGGSIKALRESGAIDDMIARGIEHISYFQVDNPLANVIDPVFIGRHAAAPDSSAEMSSKMVPKAYPEEKVGVFCRCDGKTMVIEYSDLPAKLAQERDERGNLRFIAGSIAIHLFGVRFIEKLTADPDRFGLPWHRAEKKSPYVDLATGVRVEPEKPNVVKLETFVFDALPLAESSIVCETSRVEEFAPIKNAEGVDSPATSHQLQCDKFGGWLERHGVHVPRTADGHVDARIEISPLTALEPGDLAGIDLPREIAPGSEVAL
jgi:UDP-N-acetylglucosamine/UDP-N-acetylgalactosamine diphosphorylase